MNWFFIALGAPFLWALSNITDKYLVERFSNGERSPGGLVLFSSLIGIFVALGILTFTKGIFNISLTNIFLLILAGALSVIWIILYLFALKIEETSTVAPIFLVIPVFGYIIGYLFLGEKLTSHQLIGSVIICLGAIIISSDFTGLKKKLKIKAIIYMLGASLMVAIIGIIFKYVTIEGNFWISSFWEYVGLGITGFLIFLFVPKYRSDFMLMNKEGGATIFTLNTINEILSSVGNLLTNFAILLAPVVMVYLVGTFQPAMVLLLSILGTKFFPQIVKENITWRVLIPKITAIIIMIAGSLFLFI